METNQRNKNDITTCWWVEARHLHQTAGYNQEARMKSIKVVTVCNFCKEELEEISINRVDSNDNSPYKVKTDGCLCEQSEKYRQLVRDGKI